MMTYAPNSSAGPSTADTEARATQLTDQLLSEFRQEMRAEGFPDVLGHALLTRLRPRLIQRVQARLLARLQRSTAQRSSSSDLSLPELWSSRQRTEANLTALKLLARGGDFTAEERTQLALYSGWGGLSIQGVQERLPDGLPVPESRGLIHEYYSPTAVAISIARLLQPLMATLPGSHNEVLAIEPSAGIGRLIHATSGAGFERLRWKAVEYSATSAALLRALRPDIEVFEGPFERFIHQKLNDLQGQVGLILSNPPYGQRGAALVEDSDKRYRDDNRRAYLYFLRRGLDLLAPGGLGVFLIPAGWLSSLSRTASELRTRVLLRHHLSAAFRLPNEPLLIPGAGVIIDVLFFRARGGELPELLPEDRFIAEGHYFKRFPQHVMGQESGAPGDQAAGEGETPEKSAEQQNSRAYRQAFDHVVKGTFTGLPALIERPYQLLSESHFVEHIVEQTTDVLAEEVEAASQLGKRTETYFQNVANERITVASALWGELTDALRAWKQQNGNPWQHVALRQAINTKRISHGERFLAAFTSDGALIDSLISRPVVESRYPGRRDDIVQIADWFYRQNGILTISQLDKHASELGITWDHDLAPLFKANWCLDGDELDQLLPEDVYYTGDLWPRLRRIQSYKEDPQLVEQVIKLRRAMKLLTPEEMHTPNPWEAWIPLTILEQWFIDTLKIKVTLTKDKGLLWARDVNPLHEHTLDYRNTPLIGEFVGAVNNDRSLFTGTVNPPVDSSWWVRQQLPEETRDDVRRALRVYWRESFQSWLENNPSQRTALTNVYNRTFRGFLMPDFPAAPLQLARWQGRIQLKPHQVSGARRVLASRKGMIAFDVGVGKTYTGIAVVAKAREEGWCRRPVVVVPNSIIWKWEADFRRVLPDYRICIMGAKRQTLPADLETASLQLTDSNAAERFRLNFPRKSLGYSILHQLSHTHSTPVVEVLPVFRSSDKSLLMELERTSYLKIHRSKPLIRTGEDTRQERTQKWSRFQAGDYDVMLMTYSMLTRTQMREETLSAFIQTTPAIQRRLELKQQRARNKKRNSERDEAISLEALEAEMAELFETNLEADPVYWEDMGVDLLMVDEAQNFKNLYLPEPREGGVPKYLGNPSKGSQRAWALDVRCRDIRSRTGGAGVILLSATPAKNSPLEFYNLIQFIDPEIWLRMGILHSENFIDHFCIISSITAPNAFGVIKSGVSACTGFQNLDTLREAIFRSCDIKTAEQVGLKLPEPKVYLREVDMDSDQESKYTIYAEQIDSALNAMASGRKSESSKDMNRLELLMKMSQVAIHSELDQYYTWENALTVPDVSSPKFVECAQRIVATQFQYELFQGQQLEGASLEGSTLQIEQGTLTIVAHGSTHQEQGTIEIQRLVDGQFTTLRQHTIKGHFSQTLFDGVLPSTRIRAILEGLESVTIVANGSNQSVDGSCRISAQSCRCGHIIFCDSVVVHRWMVEVLVRHGIPRERIAVLNGKTAPNPADRTRMAADFNGDPEEGRLPLYDVILCNAIAYEGIDLQTRTCAIHHLDLPWEPSTLQQRNGRGVRQGNLLSSIEINYYFSRRSSDGSRFNLITGKRNWLTSLLTSMERETNNPAAQQNFSHEEMLLLVSRNPERTRELLQVIRANEREREATLRRIRLLGLVRSARHLLSAAQTAGLVEARAHRTEAERLLKTLHEQNDGLWRFESTLDGLSDPEADIPYSDDLPILRPGLRLRLNGELVELGRKNESYASNPYWIRRVGSTQWHTPPNFAKELHTLLPEDCSVLWPVSEDEEGIQRELPNGILTMLRAQLWREMSWLRCASDGWLTRWWPVMEPHVRSQLSIRAMQFQLIPIITAGKLELVKGPQLAPSIFEKRSSTLIPPTMAGLEQYLSLLSGARVSYEMMLDGLRYWWQESDGQAEYILKKRGIRKPEEPDTTAIEEAFREYERTPLPARAPTDPHTQSASRHARMPAPAHSPTHAPAVRSVPDTSREYSPFSYRVVNTPSRTGSSASRRQIIVKPESYRVRKS